MRLLIELSGQIDDWHRSFAAASDRPRLPLPFSSSSALVARKHEVSAIHFTDESFSSYDKGHFRKLYGPQDLKQALVENDLAIFWASRGIRAVASELIHLSPRRKVILASYVWRVPPGLPWKVKGLAFTTRFVSRYARGAVLMTDEQASAADRDCAGTLPVLRFTWGIDSTFYRRPSEKFDVSGEVEQQAENLLSAPYLILAGDQQRLDDDAVNLVENYGLRLVRLPQERSTAYWYRQQIRERGLDGRLFVFERVNYPTLRFLLQNALAYVGLVDSTWQPAGWTVLCEALASGTPAIVYEGLTTREMRRLGAGDFLVTVTCRDIPAVAWACEQMKIKLNGVNSLGALAQNFAENVLDLQRTAADFVDGVERILAS